MKQTIPLGLLVLLPAAGCAQEIEIENQEANVTSIGPLARTQSGNIVIPFTVRDPEGDDQDALVQICDAPDDTCLAAATAPAGDPMRRLPTVPRGTDVPHEFRWQPWCGRWTDSGLEPVRLEEEYVASVRLLSSDTDPIYSAGFTLEALGASEAGECDQ